ncbi:MAG: prepilin-type N-terminal cleavage/methylation domain-containing protein [Verrucomicrobiae bacterium]
MKTPTSKLSVQSAFSLVELLVVIAVIAVIAAIAIPNIANITGAASASKDMRNAQSLASAFNAARAAGYNTDMQTKALAVADVVAGITGTGTGAGGNGASTGMRFGVPNLAAGEITAALTYLVIDTPGTASTLSYDQAGGH